MQPAARGTLTMSRSLQMIAASAAVAALVAIVWLEAPVVPVLIGAIGAAAVLLYRTRRP